MKGYILKGISMKMYYILICVVPSIFQYPLKAYLDVGYGLKSPVNQKIFLLGDNHSLKRKDADASQFEAMLELIQATEGLPADKKMKIYIEYPHFNIIDPMLNRCKKPSRRLLEHTKDLALQNTTLEDCDVRKVQGAAHVLLSFWPEKVEYILKTIEEDPLGIPLHWMRSFGCRLETLTFQDLFDNYDIWMRLCGRYRDMWESAAIKKVFNDMLGSSLDYFNAYVRKKLADESVDVNQKIHEYSLCYWRKYGYAPHNLQSSLIEAFSVFLEIYTLHQILLLQSSPCYNTIIVCTGSSHSQLIYLALKKLGYRDICDPIVGDLLASLVEGDWFVNPEHGLPLPPEYFKKFLLTVEELEEGMKLEVKTEEASGCIVM